MTPKVMREFKKVFMFVILEGNGVDKPYREVRYFYDDDTERTLIARYDPLENHIITD